jgi:hypothetical protein
VYCVLDCVCYMVACRNVCGYGYRPFLVLSCLPNSISMIHRLVAVMPVLMPTMTILTKWAKDQPFGRLLYTGNYRVPNF